MRGRYFIMVTGKKATTTKDKKEKISHAIIFGVKS
jgi:hypothetical protein